MQAGGSGPPQQGLSPPCPGKPGRPCAREAAPAVPGPRDLCGCRRCLADTTSLLLGTGDLEATPQDGSPSAHVPVRAGGPRGAVGITRGEHRGAEAQPRRCVPGPAAFPRASPVPGLPGLAAQSELRLQHKHPFSRTRPLCPEESFLAQDAAWRPVSSARPAAPSGLLWADSRPGSERPRRGSGPPWRRAERPERPGGLRRPRPCHHRPLSGPEPAESDGSLEATWPPCPLGRTRPWVGDDTEEKQLVSLKALTPCHPCPPQKSGVCRPCPAWPLPCQRPLVPVALSRLLKLLLGGREEWSPRAGEGWDGAGSRAGAGGGGGQG